MRDLYALQLGCFFLKYPMMTQESTWHDNMGFLVDASTAPVRRCEPMTRKRKEKRKNKRRFTFIPSTKPAGFRYPGRWFRTCFIYFFHILGLIIPIDFHTFQRAYCFSSSSVLWWIHDLEIWVLQKSGTSWQRYIHLLLEDRPSEMSPG